MDWIKVYESELPYKVELAKAYLSDEHQIDAIVLNKKETTYHIFGRSELYVHVTEAVLAKFLLENEAKIESDV